MIPNHFITPNNTKESPKPLFYSQSLRCHQ
jgi:hypothetical protein